MFTGDSNKLELFSNFSKIPIDLGLMLVQLSRFKYGQEGDY